MTYVAMACALTALGVYALLTRRDLIGVLASIEVLIGAGLVLLTTLGSSQAGVGDASTEAIALLVLVVAAAEAAVGLALLIAVARARRSTRVDELTEVRG